MQTILSDLTGRFSAAIGKAFPDLEAPVVEVTQSTNARFGHYQCNSAMKLGRNPREAAQAIIDAIDLQGVGKAEIAGPGFINVTLEPSLVAERVNALCDDPRLGVPVVEPKRVICEFSSPNIAKEMHVGHLRSTIIGDAIARLLEFLGHDVRRLNHVGDWGTQFGMLIAYMKRFGAESSDLSELVEFYKKAKALFDEDADFKRDAQLEVVALQGGDPDSLAFWKQICDVSRIGFQQIYDILDVKLEERGESSYNPVLGEVVADLESKGMVQVSQGAKCIYLDGFVNREGDPLPMIVQKSDGGYLYATTDMAAIRERAKEADWIVVVTDAGQATHFQMVFQAAIRAGYVDPAKVRLDHVTFGLVLGADGKKFRTRSGETEKLSDLLDRAVEKAGELLAEREMESDELAQKLGIAAVKYADLSCNRTGDYTFSYDRMLRFEGNTAAFLLYAYVRIHGIKRKIGKEVPLGPIELTHPSEEELALHLCRFGEAIELVARDLLPNRLAEYLYGLAERFNAFFRDCRVEGSEHQASRLALCEATAAVLKQGLQLLGIPTVERM
jgi:arginyl-tRNA synthetase